MEPVSQQFPTAEQFRALVGSEPKVFYFGSGQTRAERAAMLETVPGWAQADALAMMKNAILGHCFPRDESGTTQGLIYYMGTEEESDAIYAAGDEELRLYSRDWRLCTYEAAGATLCDFNGWPGDNEAGAGMCRSSAGGPGVKVYSNQDQDLATTRADLEEALEAHAARRLELPSGAPGPEEDA